MLHRCLCSLRAACCSIVERPAHRSDGSRPCHASRRPQPPHSSCGQRSGRTASRQRQASTRGGGGGSQHHSDGGGACCSKHLAAIFIAVASCNKLQRLHAAEAAAPTMLLQAPAPSRTPRLPPALPPPRKARCLRGCRLLLHVRLHPPLYPTRRSNPEPLPSVRRAVMAACARCWPWAQLGGPLGGLTCCRSQQLPPRPAPAASTHGSQRSPPPWWLTRPGHAADARGERASAAGAGLKRDVGVPGAGPARAPWQVALMPRSHRLKRTDIQHSQGTRPQLLARAPASPTPQAPTATQQLLPASPGPLP